jgi:RNA polymerase sigma factor (sigma-70 family)
MSSLALQLALPSRPGTGRLTSRPFVVQSAAPPTDHQLMLAVRAGELEALGELFERHQGRLFGFLARLTGDRTSAEDLVQTVFHRILKYRHTYRDEGSFAAWMYHLARRCAADHFRKASSSATAVAPADLDEHVHEGPGAADDAEAEERRALLQRALAHLEPADREVLLLSRIRELSFAEVAGILECSVGAARVRAHRALKALREQFFALGEGNAP